MHIPANIEFNKQLNSFEQRFLYKKQTLAKKLKEYLAVRDLLLMFISYSEMVENDLLLLVNNPLSKDIPNFEVFDEQGDFVSIM